MTIPQILFVLVIVVAAWFHGAWIGYSAGRSQSNG